MRRPSILALAIALGVGGLVAGCGQASPSGVEVTTGPTISIPATSPGPTAAPIATALASPVSTAQPETPSPAERLPPDGLIAVEEYQAGDATVFPSTVFSNPSISGVALRMNWMDVEPAPGQFDWETIDQVFTQAAGRKFVVLILVPGFGTPTWALAGISTATFVRQYGRGAGQAQALPLPWDQAYLAAWFTFLKAVADRYGGNPAFRMISAAGPTSVSVEMSLPNAPADMKRWVELGYTPARYEAAWLATFQAYERIFPAQHISLALYPGLSIGNDGKADTGQRTSTPAAIVAEGLRAPAAFALQTSGLTANRGGSEGYDQVQSNSGRIITGFQLSTSATKSPDQMGDATDPVHALDLTFQRGLAAHVDFLEVYLADVLNPAMQDVLSGAASQLPH